MDGKWKNHLVAYARRKENAWAIFVASRFLTGVVKEGELSLGPKVWADTHIIMPDDAPTTWRNVITGRTVRREENLPIGEILADFPVALLVGEELYYGASIRI